MHKLEPDGKRGACSRFLFPQRNLFVVEAYPHASSYLWRKPYEPSIRVILSRSGFPSGRAAKYFGLYAGAELNDFLEHGRHGARDVGGKYVVHFGMGFFEQRAIITGYPANHVCVDANAVVGENRERRDVLKKLHVRSAQGQRQIGRQRRRDAEPLSHIHDRVDANLFCEFYGWNVA